MNNEKTRRSKLYKAYRMAAHARDKANTAPSIAVPPDRKSDEVNRNASLGRDETAKERSFEMERKSINRFIRDLESRGRTYITLRKYKRVLTRIYHALPEGKMVSKLFVENFLYEEKKRTGYSSSTINSALSGINEYMKYMGYGDIFIEYHPHEPREVISVTTEDYLKVLKVARESDNREAYLLVAIFANVPFGVAEMSVLSIEAVKEGCFVPYGGNDPVFLDKKLADELLAYARFKRIRRGAIFRTSRGTPMGRQLVAKKISAVGRLAGFPARVITARNLQNLYQSRIAALRTSFEEAVIKAYGEQLNEEFARFEPW